MVYFNARVIPELIPTAAIVKNPLLFKASSCLIKPAAKIAAGTPKEMTASEFETNLKNPSDGSAAAEFKFLSIRISRFWEKTFPVKKARKIISKNRGLFKIITISKLTTT